MDERVQVGGLGVAASLHRFVEEEALPGSGVDPQAFWDGAGAIMHDLAPRNRELLARREELQSRIDDWHREHPGTPDPEAVHGVPARDRLPRSTSPPTSRSPPPTSTTRWPRSPGPSWWCRCSTRASRPTPSNARWGSLYDALYGTDVVPHEGDLAPGDGYNKVRGDEVIARARAFLDEHFPLASGSHADATSYAVDDDGLAVTVKDDVVRLADPAQWSATAATPTRPRRCCWCTTACTSRSRSTATTPSASTDGAGVKDLLLESAVSTIMDLEDSVAAVDADDKVLGYRNWLRLMQGTLSEEVTKGGKTFTRVDEPRPHLHHPLRRRRHAARPLAAVHPPGRPPDDHRRGARPGRQRGARGHPRRDHDGARQRHGRARAAPSSATPAPARCTS